jgi:uncharacterized membrane protein YdjX (TVP38/TMEM64 family)
MFQERKMNKRILAVPIFVMSLVLIAHLTGIRSQINLIYIKSLFDDQTFISTFGYILVFTIGNLIQVPGWLFLVAAVLTLGTVPGYLLTLSAAMVSTIVGFFLIRFIGKDSLEKVKFSWVKKIIKHTKESPIRNTVILRFIFQTAPPINYALALSGISFKNYLLGSIIGLPIPVFIYTFFIDELSKLAY